MKKSPEENEALGLLGLAHRAGVTVLGVEATRKLLKAGGLHVVLCAADASGVQLEKVGRLLRHREVPVRWVARRSELGRALGAGSVSVVGIRKHPLASRLLHELPSRLSDSPEREGPWVKQEEQRSDAGR